MTCPSCSRSTRDFTNSSGLVTRCDDAWHATGDTPPAHEPLDPARIVGPEDFARQEPNAAVWQKSTWHENSPRDLPDSPTYRAQPDKTPHRCRRCGGSGADPEHEGRCGECWPFDPDPPKLIPADNGYRWCDGCDSVVEAKGHECRTLEGTEAEDYLRWLDTGRSPIAARAEFSESLLCAICFDHKRATMAAFGPCRARCVACDAERDYESRASRRGGR